MKTGEKIRNLRQKQGWTQQELGNRVGYSKQYLSDIERGTVDCYPLLRKMAEVFQVSCQDLLDDSHEQTVYMHKKVYRCRIFYGFIQKNVCVLRRKQGSDTIAKGENVGRLC